LPTGFHRIRHYGLFGNRHRTAKLARCRQLLGMSPSGPVAASPDYRDRHESADRRVAAHVSDLRRRTHDGGRGLATCVHAASPHRHVMTRPTAAPQRDAPHMTGVVCLVSLSTRRLDGRRALQAPTSLVASLQVLSIGARRAQVTRPHCTLGRQARRFNPHSADRAAA